MKQHEFHSVAGLFPAAGRRVAGARYDIKANGLQVPIIVDDESNIIMAAIDISPASALAWARISRALRTTTWRFLCSMPSAVYSRSARHRRR